MMPDLQTFQGDKKITLHKKNKKFPIKVHKKLHIEYSRIHIIAHKKGRKKERKYTFLLYILWNFPSNTRSIHPIVKWQSA